MKENKVTNWIRTHTTEILFWGSVFTTTVGISLLINDLVRTNTPPFVKLEPIRSQHTNVRNEQRAISMLENTPILKMIDVKEHLRNLPKGHHPSALKIAEAASSGIDLLENQTLVSAHPRCYVA